MPTAFNPTVFQPQGTPNYAITPVAGNPAKLPDGMTQLNDIMSFQGNQLDLAKKQALLQPSIEQGVAQAESAKTGAQQAQFNLQQVQAEKAKGLVYSLLNSPNWTDPAKMEDEFSHIERIGHYQGLPKHPDEPLEEIKKIYKKQGPDAARQALFQMTTGNQAPVTQLDVAIKGLTGPGPTGAQVAPSAAPAAPQAQPVPELSQPIKPIYPVRAAGQAYALAPSEQADKDAGFGYRNSLVNRQSQLTTERRNIDEVVKTANELEKSWMPTSGILGSAYRHLATWAGDPTYIQLSKDLANTTLSNMKALGLNTDADKQLVSAAQGNYTYPPEVLMNIANRAKADMTNIDMQATAAQKYADKFGDNNMKAFQQMWSKNADSKVFEVMNLAKDTELSKQDKEKIVEKLMGPKDSPERKVFNQKYQNILKLQQNGTL